MATVTNTTNTDVEDRIKVLKAKKRDIENELERLKKLISTSSTTYSIVQINKDKLYKNEQDALKAVEDEILALEEAKKIQEKEARRTEIVKIMQEKTIQKTMRNNNITRYNRRTVEEGLAKVKTWTEDTPIYFYLGHGEDLCDKQGRPYESHVSDKNIYVTIAQCGAEAYHTSEKLNTILNSSDKIQEILRYIYRPTNTKKLAKLLHIDPDNIHVKLPGIGTSVSVFYPTLDWHKKDYIQLTQSGLIDRSEFINENYPILEDFFLYIFTLEEIGITEDTSLPKKDFFATLLTNIDTKYTGVYKAKLASMMREKLDQPQVKANLEKRFPGEDIVLTFKDMKEFLENYILTISTKTILDYYRGSVVPTENQLKRYLRDYKEKGELSIKEFTEFKQMCTQALQKKQITNELLMKKFPGIHFNIACRVVPEKCLLWTLLYRSRSAQRKRIMKNVTRKAEEDVSEILGAGAGTGTQNGGRFRKTRRAKH